jgi:PleD family two-component response regulator
MIDIIKHDFELYSLDDLKILLGHELKRSRRYEQPLAFIHIAVEAQPQTPVTQHAAEVLAIDALNVELRETDIPCRDGNEFLVLLPSTDEQGARVTCTRLEKLLNVAHQTNDGDPIEICAFIGLSSVSAGEKISAIKLMQQAARALKNAREQQMRQTVVFAEVH